MTRTAPRRTTATLALAVVLPGLAAAPAVRPAPIPRPGARPGAYVPPTIPAPTIHVGEKAHLNFTLTDRSTFTGASCRDKITVLFFWMSLDHSLASARQMTELQEKYADKGLQIIGINGDHKLDDMEASVKELGLAFPQSWTGYWRENKVARDFGIPNVNYAVVIGPDATVLFVGPAARTASEVDKAFLNHAPRVAADDDLTRAKSLLDSARKSLDAGDPLAAFRAYASLPPQALKDPVISKPAGDLRSKLSHSADAALTAADALATAGKNVDAATSLKAIIQTLGTMTGSADAQKRLDALMSRPEVKLEVQRAEHAAAATDALAAARNLRDAGSDEAAYHRFRAITMDYADTPAATAAAAAIKAYDADPVFQRKLRDTAAAPKATTALNIADNYRKANRTDQARRMYQDILNNYPDTRFAEAAKQALADLPQ